MEQFKQKFIEEAADLIQDLEVSALALSEDPENKEHIEIIFRVMHSLKGSSSMFGFDMIDHFTHQMESAFDRIRKGQDTVTDKFMDLIFKSIDHIKDLLNEDDYLSEQTLITHENLLRNISDTLHDKPEKVSLDSDDQVPANTSKASYYIKFKPKPEIFKNGTNPILTVNELISLGDFRIFPQIDNIPDINEMDVYSCYVSWVVILVAEASESEIRDVFIFVDLDSEITIKKISEKDVLADEGFIRSLDNTVSAGKVELADIENILKKNCDKESERADIKQVKKLPKIKESNISSIRVSSEKLDELINMVSELVTRQAALSLISEQINNKELIQLAEDIEKITRRLRDDTFGIRLIPVENMVTRFQRLVRELSAEMKKDIVFETEGTDTELDKNMIEGLIDPLMHIIRNSIDHGIEDTDTRVAKGKPSKGKIKLKAYYSGTNVFMEVSDDGKGIDPDIIYKRALNSGLITSDSGLAEKDIFDLIFLPGFSTAENVTKVSGRGVGMDVVKRKISDLRGEVAISSEIDKGTVITLKLPLTLSIIDGLLVRIDRSFFVIPLSFVSRCVEFGHQDLVNSVNNLINAGNVHIPFAYLRREFDIKSEPPANEQVVIIEYDDSLFGLAVDHVVGEYQAVLKSLGNMYKDQEIISGATILGDGTVALLLDPNKLVSAFSYKNLECNSQ